MTKGLQIGALSRQTGVSVETIRYYEREGLLPVPARTAGGYRFYGASDLRRLGFIRRTRGLGFSLDEIRRLLSLADRKSRSCGAAHALASRHLADIRTKIADLRKMETVLDSMVQDCAEGTLPECPLLEALAGWKAGGDSPAQRQP